MYFSKISKIVMVVLFALGCKTIAIGQSTIDNSFGKGISLVAKDSSFSMNFGFRFQTLYEGTYNLDTDSYSEELMIRRSRLKFGGYAFNPNVVYKVELALSNRDTQSGAIDESGFTSNIVLDAVVKWTFAPGWQLWFGQTKLPGNRERVISSYKLQFVDRSMVNSRFNLDRDIGVQLHHKSTLGTAVIKQAVAISTGEGRNIIDENYKNGRQFTGRVELLPMGEFTSKGDYFGSDLKREPSPKLSIGITGDYNHKTTRSRGNLGGFVTDAVTGDYIGSNLTTIFIDAMFKYNGLSIASEYANRGSSIKDDFGYGNGFVAQTGYLFGNNVELSGRYTKINAGSALSSVSDAEEFTVGFSKYVVGHNLKVQSDASYQTIGTTDYLVFRLQFEMHL
jgi:phosphate-selective porin OprO and OprP